MCRRGAAGERDDPVARIGVMMACVSVPSVIRRSAGKRAENAAEVMAWRGRFATDEDGRRSVLVMPAFNEVGSDAFVSAAAQETAKT